MITDDAAYLAVIPARGGSKGVPRKNLRPLLGTSLLQWSISHVERAETPMRVVVTTDDPEIARVASEAGAEVPFLRPAELSSDEAPTEPAVLHALEAVAPGSAIRDVVLLQPTSPVRRDGSLDEAVRQYEASGADSLVSVVRSSPFLWRGPRSDPSPLYDVGNRRRRQDLAEDEHVYQETGSIYITSVEALVGSRNRISGRTILFEMTPDESLDVDSEEDLRLAEQLLGRDHAD
jgi:CMP-N,N'-diacetyllegionaminic acid synthase